MASNFCNKCLENEERVKNYERRLAIITEEKDLAVEMFQEGVKRIEKLQDELNWKDDNIEFDLFKKQIKQIHVQMQSDYSDAIIMLERKLVSVSSGLEMELKRATEKEAELDRLRNEIAILKIEKESWRDLQTKEEHLRKECFDLNIKCTEYENILRKVKPPQALEDDLERLKKQLSAVEKQRNEMQSALEDTQKTAEQLAADELEARQKVCEAITLVETTLVEKQRIQNQYLLSENECKRLQKELIDLIDEAGKKVKKEVESVRKNYHEQLQLVKSQMDILETEKNKKISQIEKQQQEIVRLEEEIEDMKRKSVSQRKLQAVTEELASTQTQLEKLQTENKSLNEIIMQNQHRFESEISKCGIERRFLEKQILKLQTNLGETGHNLERAVEHCHQLSDHLSKLSNELVSERIANETDSSELLKQLHLTKIQSNTAMEELKKFVNNHNNITSKWKDEYTELTMKFSERMKVLKMENKREKKRNKKLLKKLVHTKKHESNNYNHESSFDDDNNLFTDDVEFVNNQNLNLGPDGDVV